ncbi:hypothetical protein LQW54_005942 [Pestalotiopsis sp. IQ-011]
MSPPTAAPGFLEEGITSEVPAYPSGDSTPPGWPTIAAKQSKPYNTGILRKFDMYDRRVLVDQQTKIWALGRILQDMDAEDARSNMDRLETLDFDPTHLIHTSRHDIGQHSDSSTIGEHSKPSAESLLEQASEESISSPCAEYSKDQVLEALTQRITNYYLLITLSSQVERLPRVSRYSYENFRKFVQGDIPRDSDAWRALMDEEDDFITTRKGLVHEKFEWLLHGQPRFGLDNIFMRLFRHREESDTKNKYVSPTKLEFFSKMIIGLFCMAMLAGPVGILLLVPLSDAQSFGIVVAFCSVVVLGLSGLDSFYATLVAFSTYMAVLVTSLSNLYQARNH